jgi:hypothetical protein
LGRVRAFPIISKADVGMTAEGLYPHNTTASQPYRHLRHRLAQRRRHYYKYGS